MPFAWFPKYEIRIGIKTCLGCRFNKYFLFFDLEKFDERSSDLSSNRRTSKNNRTSKNKFLENVDTLIGDKMSHEFSFCT